MNEIDDNKEAKIMNSKKRKRVVNLLVRTVRNPIQHGYVVLFEPFIPGCLCIK
jgi:hypothetical protein